MIIYRKQVFTISKKGYVFVHRSIRDNWVWDSREPFDKRSAWIDLILTANHHDRTIDFNGQMMTIKRGELLTSTHVLADRWQWSRTKISKFLSQLESERMISIKKTTHYTLIKLEKYDFYQYSGELKKPQKNHRKTTKKPQKNLNNTLNTLNTLSVCNINKHPHGRFQNVFLTDEEYASFKKENADIDEIIEELSDAIETNPKKYNEGHPTAWLRKFVKQKRKTTKPTERRKILS